MSHLSDHAFRWIFNQGVTPQVILKRDAAFTVVAANMVYLHKTGQTEADVLGRAFRDVSGLDPVLMPMTAYLKTAFDKAVLQKETVRIPAVPRSANAKGRMKLNCRDVEIVPVINSDDEVEYLICSVQRAASAAAIDQYNIHDKYTDKRNGPEAVDDQWKTISTGIGASNKQLLSMSQDLERIRKELQTLLNKI